jgi:hypothetical protein
MSKTSGASIVIAIVAATEASLTSSHKSGVHNNSTVSIKVKRVLSTVDIMKRTPLAA